VVFIDGKCDLGLLHKLYYYCHIIHKRPFFPLLPFSQRDDLTYSWNPLMCTQLESRTITESVFNAFQDPHMSKDSESAFYSGYQRTVFSHLMSALRFSEHAVSMQDLRLILEYDEILSSLQRFIKPQGTVPYSELMRLRNEDGKQFAHNMKSFVNYLSQFSHWSLNSYNPTIQFDRLMLTDSVVYVGLPVNDQPYLMGCLGNIMINQLKALSQYVQSHQKHKRHAILCIVDEAGRFVDSGLTDWLAKVRSSGFMLMLGIQLLADLEGRKAGFAKQVKGNTNNVIMFRTPDPETAQWFVDLAGQELAEARAANIEVAGDEVKETGAGNKRAYEREVVPRDAIYKLRKGQCYFFSEATLRPVLMAGCFYPDPIDRPDRRYVKIVDPRPAELSGLSLWYYMANERIRLSSQLQGQKPGGG